MAFDPITAIANVANTVLTRVLPDKPAQDAAKLTLAEMQMQGEFAKYADQIQVDNTEASSKSVFVAGWRPFVGWVCGFGMAYQMILRPLLSFAVHLFHGNWAAPGIETQDLIGLLTGMLGLATARTVEKVQGVNAGH